jgi:predicted O-methyltransferase YrrM
MIKIFLFYDSPGGIVIVNNILQKGVEFWNKEYAKKRAVRYL